MTLPRVRILAACVAASIAMMPPAAWADSPYPQSKVVAGVEFDWTTRVRLAPGSDNWPVTWADDDHQYSAWGDGGGFGGTNTDGRVSLGFGRIEGPRSGYKGSNLWGGKRSAHQASFPGKCYGMLSVDGDLYAAVNDCDCDAGPNRLYNSSDHAASWSAASWTIPGGGGDAAFLQFGKGYTGARDGFVYIYAPMHRWDMPGKRVWLARVPKADIMSWDAWEFYGGTSSAGPVWTSWSKREAVFEDTRVCWAVSVSYNAGLKRYLLCTTHHDPLTERGLGIFEAPEPWGPWNTVARYDTWSGPLGKGSTFFYSFSNKWTTPDGLNFVMIWTGTGDHDAWNTVEGRFRLAPADASASSSLQTPADTLPASPVVPNSHRNQ